MQLNQDVLGKLKGYMHLLYIVLGAVLVAGSVFYHLDTRIRPLREDWGNAIATTERMQAEADRLQALQGRLPVLIQTVEDGRKELQRVRDYLPHQKDFPGLVSQISLAANQYSVRLTEITASEISGDAEIAPVALRIGAVSTYPNLLRFLSTLERLERIVTIREIRVTPATADAAGAPRSDLVSVQMLLASYSLVSPDSVLASAPAPESASGAAGSAQGAGAESPPESGASEGGASEGSAGESETQTGSDGESPGDGGDPGAGSGEAEDPAARAAGSEQ